MRTLPFQRESPFVSLTSLALAPPHRPAVLYEDVYSPILRSHSWVRRYAVLQELGDPDASSHLDGRRGVPRGHTVIKEAYGSTGCVNASAWESRGAEARLATAGDDTKCVNFEFRPSKDVGRSDLRKCSFHPGSASGRPASKEA